MHTFPKPLRSFLTDLENNKQYEPEIQKCIVDQKIAINGLLFILALSGFGLCLKPLSFEALGITLLISSAVIKIALTCTPSDEDYCQISLPTSSLENKSQKTKITIQKMLNIFVDNKMLSDNLVSHFETAEDLNQLKIAIKDIITETTYEPFEYDSAKGYSCRKKIPSFFFHQKESTHQKSECIINTEINTNILPTDDSESSSDDSDIKIELLTPLYHF